MKKIFGLFCSIMLFFLSVIPVQATSRPFVEVKEGSSFEIRDVIGYAKVYGIRNESAITRIPLNLNLEDNISTKLVVEITPSKENLMTQTVANSSGVLNFSVTGNFYRTSDRVTVTVYGLSGSFEYTGKDTSITGRDSYHNSTFQGWSGTSRTSTSKISSYNISVLKGDYTLFEKNKENNSAWIKIAVSQSRNYSVGGEYTSYDVN